MSDFLAVSIVIEALIAILCLASFISKKKKYMAGFAITFAIYVLYDLARFTNASLPGLYVDIAFFLATLCALASAWQIYSDSAPAAKKK